MADEMNLARHFTMLFRSVLYVLQRHVTSHTVYLNTDRTRIWPRPSLVEGYHRMIAGVS